MTRFSGLRNRAIRKATAFGTKARGARTCRRTILEPLEGRTLLTLSVNIDNNHAIQVVETGTSDDLTVSYDAASNTYTFTDPTEASATENDTSGDASDSAASVTNGLTLTSADFFLSLTVSTGGGVGIVNLLSEGSPTTIADSGTINLGATGAQGTMQGLGGTVTIADPDPVDLYLNDGSDVTVRNVTIAVDNTGASGSVSGLSPNPISFFPGQLAAFDVNGGSGGNTFEFDGTPAAITTTVNPGTGANSVVVTAAGDQTDGGTLDIDGGSNNSVVLGANANGLQSVFGVVNVSDSGGRTDLTLNDLDDVNAVSATMSDTAITGLAPAAINYTATEIGALTVDGGSGNNTFTVTNTIPGATNLNSGLGFDLVVVQGTAAGSSLGIDGQNGVDTVTIGNSGLVSGILGSVDIDNDLGQTNLTIDDSADSTARSSALTGGAANGALTGLAPGAINYTTSELNGLTLKTGLDASLDVNVTGGNPIPGGQGLELTTGAGSVLDLLGTLPSGAFSTETHTATGQHQGSISFVDSAKTTTGLSYSGLSQIIDSTSASAYTFNDEAFPDSSFAITAGTANSVAAATIASTAAQPGFIATTLAKKTALAIDTYRNLVADNIAVNLPTQPAALTSLTINATLGGMDQVSVQATPPGVATAIDTGPSADTVSVTGAGLASGTTLTLDGGTGANTLNVNAGGAADTVAAGTMAGAVVVTQPGSGGIHSSRFGQLNLTNSAASPLILQATFAVPAAKNVSMTIIDIANFRTATPGAAASDFSAAISWGDGSASTAGTIVQDASDPTLFRVEGSHTYGAVGLFSIKTSLSSSGSPGSYTTNGVTITDPTSPVGPTVPAASAVAAVSEAPLVVTANAISGVAGSPTASTVLARFVDPGGIAPNASDPDANYTAAVNWGDGTALETLPSSAIARVGTTNSFTVLASHLYAAAGTYTVSVTVTEASTFGIPGLGTGNSTASIAPVVFAINGMLNPASDSGRSQSDGITDITQPNFIGHTEAGATVQLFVAPVGGGFLAFSGATTADAQGAWSITAAPLTDGSYNVFVKATSTSGDVSPLTPIGPLGQPLPVVIDTAGPTVVSVRYTRATGQLQVTFQDNLSGLAYPSLTNVGNYTFASTRSRSARTTMTNAVATAGLLPTSAVAVALTINNGQRLRGGLYLLTVRSGGIVDAAGNPLNGHSYGTVSTGQAAVGGNFVARVDLVHNRITPLSTTPVKDRPHHTAAKDHAKALHDTALAALSHEGRVGRR